MFPVLDLEISNDLKIMNILTKSTHKNLRIT